MLKTFQAAALFLVTVAVVTVVTHAPQARADDNPVEVLKPGFDGGTYALTSTNITGKQVMIDCQTFEVRLKACTAADQASDGGCQADGRSSRVFADKQTDICLQQYEKQISVYRPYDGGVGLCNLYTVWPHTVCP